jgi:hypothetical protein
MEGCSYLLLSSKGISKLKSIEVHNAILVDWDSEQQNITHFTILGTKQSFLFTASTLNEC